MGMIETTEKLWRKLWFEWGYNTDLKFDKTYQAPCTVQNIPRRSPKENIVIEEGSNLEREESCQFKCYIFASECLVRPRVGGCIAVHSLEVTNCLGMPVCQQVGQNSRESLVSIDHGQSSLSNHWQSSLSRIRWHGDHRLQAIFDSEVADMPSQKHRFQFIWKSCYVWTEAVSVSQDE